MHSEFLMGNEAIARGALAAGVNSVSGYPGTPSTEVLETVAKNRGEGCYVEWSANEKAALEVAAGAALSGARAMVTMKQVGLNVAADPLMSLAYIGVKAGMVVMVADDPGPISSQTEQDTRHFASFSKLPCFDPSSVQEAYEMIGEAFAYSEQYHTPVLFRPTTRICHGYASVVVKDDAEITPHTPLGFEKDPSKWVIFPRLSFMAHGAIEKRNTELSSVFSDYARNTVQKGTSRKGIASQGISFAYVQEAADDTVSLFKVSTPFPFPEQAALRFLEGLDEVLCIEELDPVIERELIYICGKYGLKTLIRGKQSGNIAVAGENTRDSVADAMNAFLGRPQNKRPVLPQTPPLPVRPPVLCAGCPHRASFLAVKEAMKGKDCVFCGDIGCYTLGNAAPLDMVDTCLCMGAGVNMAQSIARMDKTKTCFSFVGDSTFFASGIAGVVNGVYNEADMCLVILDNSTTAMTGHQPHPGTGHTMMGQVVEKIDMVAVLKGIGVKNIFEQNPLHFASAVQTVKEAAACKGVKAIIFRSPCVALFKPQSRCSVDAQKCIGCKKCMRTLGCPAITLFDGKAKIDGTCTGCTLCAQVCPVNAISGGDAK